MKLDLWGIFNKEDKMYDEYKEVYYDQYCQTCKHKDVPEVKDPCHECLSEPVNLESHKPIKWETKKK